MNIVCLHKFNSNYGLQIYTTLYTLDYFIPHKRLKYTCVTWQCDNHINELLHTLRDHQITGNVIICGWGFRVRMIIFPMINEFYLVPASSKLPFNNSKG